MHCFSGNTFPTLEGWVALFNLVGKSPRNHKQDCRIAWKKQIWACVIRRKKKHWGFCYCWCSRAWKAINLLIIALGSRFLTYSQIYTLTLAALSWLDYGHSTKLAHYTESNLSGFMGPMSQWVVHTCTKRLNSRLTLVPRGWARDFHYTYMCGSPRVEIKHYSVLYFARITAF